MTIDNFKDIKTLHEMAQYSNIYRYAEAKMDELNAYWGTDLNEEQASKLQFLHDTAVQLSDLDNKVTVNVVFNNTTPNGMVILNYPSLYFSTDTHVGALMAKLFAGAEDVSFSALGGDICVSFGIRNMWNTNGTVYDLKQQK